MAKHEIWIDALKGMAILLVVIGHNTPPSSYPILNTIIYSFHMPLFFILSGFIFSQKPTIIYLKKSSKRLLIPLFTFCIVLAIPELAAWLIVDRVSDFDGLYKFLDRIISGITWSTSGWYTITWFITVLWMATNLFNYILCKNISGLHIISIFIIGYILSLIPNPLPFRINIVPMAIVYIWIGFILRQHISRLKVVKSTHYVIGGVIALIIISLIGENARVDMKFAYYGIPIISLILSVAMSLVFRSNRDCDL